MSDVDRKSPEDQAPEKQEVRDPSRRAFLRKWGYSVAVLGASIPLLRSTTGCLYSDGYVNGYGNGYYDGGYSDYSDYSDSYSDYSDYSDDSYGDSGYDDSGYDDSSYSESYADG